MGLSFRFIFKCLFESRNRFTTAVIEPKPIPPLIMPAHHFFMISNNSMNVAWILFTKQLDLFNHFTAFLTQIYQVAADDKLIFCKIHLCMSMQ